LLKTHNCNELSRKDIQTEVTLAGWVDRRRDHGGLIFIDLRDREGIVQVVFNPEIAPDAHKIASDIRSEYVLQVKGRVAPRPVGTENPKLPTGEIEVIAGSVAVLNTAKTPPFYINEEVEIEENLRLRYRYLDLRRARMKNNILLRHRVIKFMRDFLYGRGFVEIETPILLKSTPEGARDYLVPSRVHPGKFYALPQSPQQVKQLLMVAGFEKYFQVAKCFRDEDTRADRQPEFTQLDIEMSFIDENDIMMLLEDLFTSLVAAIRPDIKVNTPIPRLPYAEAMERYGIDKPDLRFGLELRDLSDIAGRTEFSIFKNAIAQGGIVKGLCAPGCGGYSRSQLDELNVLAKGCGAGGVVTMSLGAAGGQLEDLTPETVKSVATRFLSIDQIKEMAQRLGAKPGDLLLIVAGKTKVVNDSLAQLRLEFGRRLNLMDPNTLALAFIVNFPLLDWNGEMGRFESMHHPFTQPRDEDIPLLDTAPEKVHGKHYDFVCNGFEIAGGSLRIYKPDLQRKIFNILGYKDEQVNELFGHLLEAFEYGAPPHGGVAPGIDRFVMLLAGEATIREVIAFPKNQNAVDLTFNAPDVVTEEALSLLHIRIREEDLG
jgi:aspartyl-tRNA synthetase